MARPKRKLPIDVQSLARSHTIMAIQVLSGIALRGDKDSARVAAAGILLDRGWGKAAQPHTGSDGGDIQVTLRTIIEGAVKKKP